MSEAVEERAVDIKTPDGICDATFVAPRGHGRWPGVVLYPDVRGMRPSNVEMAQRLAADGYCVLVVNQFYRTRKAPIFTAEFRITNPDHLAAAMALVNGLTPAMIARDAAAFVGFLDAQRVAATNAGVGVVGFCIGGNLAVRTAAAVPGRVAAVASFHGGFLVTPAPDSPHRLIAGTKAAYHFAIASDDDQKQPGDKTALRNALDVAGLAASLEVYPDARHGWMVPDSLPYNKEQSERGWAAMLTLFRNQLLA